jgi:hypothetical protein
MYVLILTLPIWEYQQTCSYKMISIHIHKDSYDVQGKKYFKKVQEIVLNAYKAMS